MRSTFACLVLSAALVVAVAVFAEAQQMPDFDPRPGCRAGAISGASLRADVDACVRSEEKARDELAAKWDQFVPADKARCAGLTHKGGPPSYIEVLTCVELAQIAREIRKNENTGIDDNTGLSTGMR